MVDVKNMGILKSQNPSLFEKSKHVFCLFVFFLCETINEY